MMSTVEPPTSGISSSDTPSSDKTPTSSDEKGSRKRWLGLVLLLVVVAATVTGRLVDAPDVIDTARQAIREVGPWASVVFAAVYVVATLLGFPGTPLTLACALMFGFWKAFIIMVTATTLASSIAFLVARYVARDSIERWLAPSNSATKF